MSLYTRDNKDSKFHRFFFPDNIQEKISLEEYRRRTYVYFAILLGTPVLLGYGIFGLITYDAPLSALPDLILAAISIVFAVTLRKMQSGALLYRLSMGAFAALLLYNVSMGMYAGGDILWLYVFPLVAFTIFGRKEGLLWVFLLILPTIVMVNIPSLLDSFEFKREFLWQFEFSLLVTVGFAYSIESLRESFYEQLMQQKEELQEALEGIETLSGLVPICATCKNIRDDKGYWNKVEDYLAEHTRAKFSHGTCVECLRADNPALYQEMVEAGEIPEQDRVSRTSAKPESA